MKNKIFYFSFFTSFSIILLIIFTSYALSYNTIKDTSITREKYNLELISNQTDIILNSAQSHTINFTINKDIQRILVNCSKNDTLPNSEDILDLKQELNNILYKESVISGIIVHSTNNFKLQSDPKFISLINSINNFNFNEWYGNIRDLENNHYIYISKKIFDMSSGKLIGYVEIFVDETLLSKNYDNKIYKNNSNFCIINEQGTIISASNSSELNTNIYTQYPNLNLANKKNPLKIIYDNKLKKISIMQYHAKSNWNIISKIFLDDIIYEKEKLIISLVIFSIIALICSYILSKVISKSITKPINNLYDAIDKVEKGNWSTEIKITSCDEIGILSKKFNHLIKYTKNLLHQIQYEQNKKKQFELELIQLQIKPHFLYNSLENISALAELDRNDEVVDMISSLSIFYRGILNKGENIITVKEELSLTKNYLKIMKMRYFDIFDYEILCDDSVLDHSCLKLLIQPLVENSIYHGIKNSSLKGNIYISVHKVDTNVKFIIKDTGIGMDKSQLSALFTRKPTSTSTGGFAVNNTIERLNLYYHGSANFNIKSQKNIGTEIQITIPATRKELLYDKHNFS